MTLSGETTDISAKEMFNKLQMQENAVIKENRIQAAVTDKVRIVGDDEDVSSVYPFHLYGVEEYLSDIWIGDELTLVANHTYEMLEGSENVELEYIKSEYGDKTIIHFVKEGTAKLKVIRNSDNAEKVYEFTIGQAKELEHTSLIPTKIKIGYKLSNRWCSYKNSFLGDGVFDIFVPEYSKYCIMPGENFGSGGWDTITREPESSALNEQQTPEWQWLFGAPTRPGKMYYTTELEPDKQYAIVIEEPVIETNIESEVQVGTEIQLTTFLKNTELTDKKVIDVKELINSEKYSSAYSDLIGYQPRIEILSGVDLIERSEGDYSNILSTSEKIKFVKQGTVTFKVVYEMLPITDGEHRIFKSEAFYSPEATFTVNIISESEDNSQKNGLFQQGTDWYYFKDGKIDVTYDGIASNENGTWYIENGQVDFGKTGVLSRGSGWYLFKNGQVQKITTVAQNANGWWYIKDGQVDFSYDGIASNANGTWYIENGQVDFGKTGVLSRGSGWYLFKNGQVQKITAVAQNANGWWYIKDGQVDFNATTVANNANGWWYIKDGKVDFGYGGIASNTNGTWYIENGQVDFGKTGVLSRGSGWYLFKNGQVQKITTVAQNANGWWYIKNGQVDFSYTGVAKNENGYWYIENGKLNWNYTGIAMDVNGNKYSVVNGKATKKN